jgi:glycosyltransferase involved in cell wall biosynthesis
MTLRVLMVSKACVVGAYQTKLEALARMPGMELTVVVPPAWRGPEGTSVLERAHTAGYELIVSPMRFNGSFHLHYYPHLPYWLRRLQPDILHFDEEPYNLATYLGLRAGRRVGARGLFFTWQNLYRVYPWPFRAWEQACFHLAAGALAGSADACRVLRRKGYRGPARVIPQFGVSVERFAPPAVEPPAAGPLRVGYAGRLVPEKGVDLLLRALAGLQAPWRAVIAGRGPEEGRLRAMAQELGLGDRVELRGNLPSREMPAFFAGLDVLVLP